MFDVHAEEVALVFADVVMPNMGARELIAELKKRNPHIPIVMMTGHLVSEEETTSLASQAAEFLKKPLDLLQVAQAVNRALKTKS